MPGNIHSTKPCECTGPGYCARHAMEKTEHLHQLCREREDYRRLWDELAPGNNRRAQGNCRHRGKEVGRERCRSCCGQVVVKVFDCAVHGKCTLGRDLPEVKCCRQCGDYAEEPPPPQPTSQKLILSCGLSPGDIVVMTAAVRELHKQYPGKYLTDVRTTASEIWQHNPYITPIGDGNREARRISMHYDRHSYVTIHRSNQHPIHFIEGYCAHLANELGLPSLRPTEFKGDIHLSAEEKAWMPQVQEITGRPTRYWIVNAGVKRDFTCKGWPLENYQAVVDHFAERMLFVQVGSLEHVHPPLRGVLDLRGKTDHRQLMRLIYHASGVLTGVSYAMHLAAAVERPAWLVGLRPCVVLGGGREPEQWVQYPGHRYLSTIGALSCCATGGCWKSRAVPLNDGDRQDRNLCEQPVDGYPRCMRMIVPAMVIGKIENYLAGLNPGPPARLNTRRHGVMDRFEKEVRTEGTEQAAIERAACTA